MVNVNKINLFPTTIYSFKSEITDDKSLIIPSSSIIAGFSRFKLPTLKNFIIEFGGPKGNRTPLSWMKTMCPNR